VCFGVAGGETLEISLQGGNARLPSFLIRRYVIQFLSCAIVVDVSLVIP
jgi:hypothetical protein